MASPLSHTTVGKGVGHLHSRTCRLPSLWYAERGVRWRDKAGRGILQPDACCGSHRDPGIHGSRDV